MDQRRLVHFSNIETLAPLCGGRGSAAARSGRSVRVCATCLGMMTARISAAPAPRRAGAPASAEDRGGVERARAGFEPVDS